MPLRLPDNNDDRERFAAGVQMELGLNDKVSGMLYGVLLGAREKSFSALTARHPVPNDLSALIKLQDLAWSSDPELVLPPALIKQMITHHSDLMMVMEERRTGALLGDVMAAPVQFASESIHQKAKWAPLWEQIENNAKQDLPDAEPEHFPSGWALEGLDASVHPECRRRGLGITLYLALALDLAKNYSSAPPYWLGWIRTPRYARWLRGQTEGSYAGFLQSPEGGSEPTVRLARAIGAKELYAGPCWPDDYRSGGMAVRVDRTPVIQAFINASHSL